MDVTKKMMVRAADLAERFYLAGFGGNDVAALRNGICGDSAIRDFVLQVEALRTTAQSEAAELRGLIGDAYETLKRIEQCADGALVAASAKEACGKIDAALRAMP